MKSKSESLFAPESLQRFAIEDGESSFDNALQNTGGKIPTGGLISMKSNRKIIKSEKENGSHKSDKKRHMDNNSHKSGKKEKRKRS
jgi:N-acetyltransferase 10